MGLVVYPQVRDGGEHPTTAAASEAGRGDVGIEADATLIRRAPLTAPGNLAAAADASGIALSWDDAADITITGYEYRYRSTADPEWYPYHRHRQNRLTRPHTEAPPSHTR